MTSNPDIYRVGDRFPPLALPDPTGETVNLSDQSRAGHALVLWIVGAKASREVAAALAAARGRLAAVDTPVFAVTSGFAVADVDTLCDAQGQVAGSLGLTGPALVVLDPERRLRAILPEQDGVEAVIAACEAIFGRTSETIVRAQAPVLVLPGVLEPAVCQRMIAYWESGTKRFDGVATGQAPSRQEERSIKRRADVLVLDADLTNEISLSVARRVAPAIRKSFQREITRCETPRIGCYDSRNAGAFGAHRDNTTPFTAHRLFAMSLNLNADFTGGEVRFPEYGRTLYRPDPGDAVIFSCTLLHEALPVRSGRRFGLFTFMYDEQGAKQIERVVKSELAAGRDPYINFDQPGAAPG